MSAFFQAKSFLRYWLNAVDEHSLHSPFLYDLYTQVLKKSKHESSDKSIEHFRHTLLNEEQSIPVHDYGAGSRHLSNVNRRVCDIARTSLSPPKYARLYRNIIRHFKAHTIVELGTSFGITTLYVATENAKVSTFEGAPAIAERAREIFESAGAANIHLTEGDISKTLPHYLLKIFKIDAVIMDANHRYSPTIQYFEWLLPHIHDRSILIMDDIHYSEEMEKAWHEIKQHTLVYGTADLFRCGLVFFDPSLNKQHVVLQY